MPLWMTRLRSKKLLEKVIGYDDFPILIETWRTCLKDEFDLENLKLMLGEIASGEVKWSIVQTSRPSPFASNIAWNQINRYMYEPDQPASAQSALKGDLLRDVMASPELRPAVDAGIIAEFERKRQRLSPGYSPQETVELLDWVKERILIPMAEWEELISAIERDTEGKSGEIIDPVRNKLVFILVSGAAQQTVAALETSPLLKKAYSLFCDNLQIKLPTGDEPGIDPAYEQKLTGDRSADEIFMNLLAEWLRFYGPVTIERISQLFGIGLAGLEPFLTGLVDSNDVICGKLVSERPETFFCDSENYETLLRIKRARALPVFDPLETSCLPLFLAYYQGIVNPARDIDGLFRCLEQLVCLPLPAELWESAVLPARIRGYQGIYLDRIIQESDLIWRGFEKQRTAFCFEPELDLLGRAGVNDDADNLKDLFPDPKAKFEFFHLMEMSKSSSGQLTERLWSGVWNGMISNDSYAALRKGIENRFKASELPDRKTSGRRGRRTGHF